MEACSIFSENIITLITFKIAKLVNEAKKLTLYLIVNLLKLSFNFILFITPKTYIYDFRLKSVYELHQILLPHILLEVVLVFVQSEL